MWGQSRFCEARLSSRRPSRANLKVLFSELNSLHATKTDTSKGLGHFTRRGGIRPPGRSSTYRAWAEQAAAQRLNSASLFGEYMKIWILTLVVAVQAVSSQAWALEY